MNTAHRCELDMLGEEIERLQVALSEARKQPVMSASTNTLASRREAGEALRVLACVVMRLHH